MKINETFAQTNTSKSVPELRLNFEFPQKLTRASLDTTEKRVKFLRKVFDKGTFELQEEVLLLVLDDTDFPRFWYKLGKGSKGQCLVDNKLVLQILLCTSAEKFILAHNHPTGNTKPSEADIDSTFALQHLSKYFGIHFEDEIILGKKRHYSFAENNLLWGHE